MRKNMVFLFLPIFLVFSEFCFSQTPPPPPLPPNSPVITEVSKDRLAVDDLLVIKGLNFKPQSDSQTFILFEGLPPILVQPESDSKISVVVPQGAKSAGLKVKTSTFLEGTLYELESNEIKILVVWREYDLRPIIDFFNNYFGYGNYNRNFSVVGIMTAGSNDDVFLRVNGGTVGYTIETFVHLKSDGTWDWQFLGNFWPSQSNIWDEAVDPITKSPALLLMSANYITINASGFPVSSFPNSIYAWRPYDLYYDNDGNLYVLGNYIGQLYDTSDDLCCVWKFSRGEQIILNPNNSNSLIPGGISGDLDNFAVGGNGGIAAEMWQGQNYSFLIISNGSAPQIVAPPISSLYYCDGYWNFAIDCRGTIYATNDEYGYDEWDCGPPIIYTIPDNQQLFTIPNDICGYHFPAVDGYGNIYILGDRRCVYGAPYYPVLYRITPDELPEGYYDCFSCCPPESLRAETEHCKNGVGDVNVCEEEGLAIEVSTNGNSSEREVCVILKENEEQNINVLFGEEITLTIHKKDCSEPNLVKVAYSVKSETVPELQIDPSKSLFPNKPEIIFGTLPNDGVSQIQFQTVHTGSFLLELTPKQDSTKTYKVKININTPTRLGTTYNNYDREIIKYADKYGIPPQYLKGHVHKEAKIENGQYVADSFRYEPIGWDYGTTLKKGVWKWTKNDYTGHNVDYDRFNYPNGFSISETMRSKIGKFYKITSITETDELLQYGCDTYATLNPPEYATIYNIYNANNGWAEGSYPNTAYNFSGPCESRMNWDTQSSLGIIAFHNNHYYCGTENQPETGCSKKAEAFIDFLQNYTTTYAQIPVASSYGLMQVMYVTAVQDLGWDNTKDPCLLLDANNSLDMGASFDAIKFKNYGIESANNLTDFNNALINGFSEYNNKGVSYADIVLDNANLFNPF